MNDPIINPADLPVDALVMQEIQVLLAEKRTSLSTLRTGIAIFALPLSVLSVLIATSKFYQIEKVIYWLVPLLLLNLGLIVLGIYLIVRAIRHIRHYEKTIEQFKKRHHRLTDLLG
ncbi:MAG TPA: hypothetical protein VGO57_11915 [Verrucomicrobiae bacterium]|jgi:uncharacterized membrane protein YidH (DUF202 family)